MKRERKENFIFGREMILTWRMEQPRDERNFSFPQEILSIQKNGISARGLDVFVREGHHYK
jgi:hypothetical protein